MGKQGSAKTWVNGGEEHHDQSLDLILIASCGVTQLGMQTHSFPIYSYPFGFARSRSVPLRSNRDSGNGHGVEPVGLGS